MSTLVIVESPTKAKTINKFLGKDYVVKSSFGHVRDLPKSKLGVDVENNYEPEYINSKDKSKVIKELKDAAKKTDEILFAADEDREGEAISFHLAHILGIDPAKAKRIVFHEITKHAIEEALKNPRPINHELFDAQQARRVLDRLVGYKLSPFLWRKVARGLSAGRVQSVAVRLVVEREREIQEFKPEEYWSIFGIFNTIDINKEKVELLSNLHSIGKERFGKMDIGNKKHADKILQALANVKYSISSIEKKEKKKNPLPPFITSTLQQTANQRLGFSSKQTMRIAQQLYEGISIKGKSQVGLITYMRTDSTNLSEKFLNEANQHIISNYGDKYGLDKPRVFKKKSKNAQEAHEAIRPTHADFSPDSIKDSLDNNQFRLYDLIWRRAMASQMSHALIEATAIMITSSNDYNFKSTGQVITFDGFLKLYPDKSKENLLPALNQGEKADCKELKSEQHFTEPPARYSDATLVKVLEENGIGRPSTYAPTISTIEARNYVERDDKKRFKPTDIAFVVNDLLVEHFEKILGYKFTADMEEYLDDISLGKRKWREVINDFYIPFEKNLEEKEVELKKKDITEEETDEKCDKCKSDMIIKTGRFGKFLACSNYPDCKNTKNIVSDENGKQKIEEDEKTDEKCEKCGKNMEIKRGRFGKFLGCSGYPECKSIKRIEKSTGVKCTKCKKGDIIEKRTKTGRTFYACNQYPACEHAVWSKPNGEICPKCNELMVYGPNDTTRCSNKDCGKESKQEDLQKKL